MTITDFRKLRVSVVVLLLISPLAHLRGATLNAGGLTLGDAGPSATSAHTNYWAFFSLGSNSSDTDSISGDSLIVGSVGVAGAGNLNMTGASAIKFGSVYYSSPGTVSIGGGSTTDHVISNAPLQTILNQGVQDAKALSTKASALAATVGGPTNITASTTLGSGNNGSYVFKLTNFSLNGGTLTLDGNANSSFVFDISGTFSLANASKVVLEGGLTASNVLFNYTGTSNITLSNVSSLTGIILAAASSNFSTSNVTLSGRSTVTGEVIADTVTLTGTSRITQAIVSP